MPGLRRHRADTVTSDACGGMAERIRRQPAKLLTWVRIPLPPPHQLHEGKKMPVNKERVWLLVEALRSGEFNQGTNMLRTPSDEYCCIGVGCEVARREGIGIGWKKPTDEDASKGGMWTFDGHGTAFSPKLMDWYGFPYRSQYGSGDPVLLGDLGVARSEIQTMISTNDNDHWTFEQIADALEARYLTEDGDS